VKIAVTGAAGFVGQQVIPLLLAGGHEVVAVTRAPGRVSAFAWAGAVEERAVALESASADAFELLGCPDLCLHLAWGALTNFNCNQHFERELPVHYSFLRALVEGGLSRMVVTGTCLEYGLQSGALAEDAPTDPVTPYGCAKDMLRRQLEFLARQTPFSLGWGRLFYMHGESAGRRTLLMQLKEAVTRGDRTFPMSGGEQLRDYLSVENVAKKLVLLCEANNPGVVNICSGMPISVRRLVEGWIADHGWDIALEPGRYPYLAYEPMAFWGDTTKASKVVGA
jgi:nucleoside-diphosphate-sugar epimerase